MDEDLGQPAAFLSVRFLVLLRKVLVPVQASPLYHSQPNVYKALPNLIFFDPCYSWSRHRGLFVCVFRYSPHVDSASILSQILCHIFYSQLATLPTCTLVQKFATHRATNGFPHFYGPHRRYAQKNTKPQSHTQGSHLLSESGPNGRDPVNSLNNLKSINKFYYYNDYYNNY